MAYHYPTPEQPSTPESPWAGLSDEARESLTRHVSDNSPARSLLSPEVVLPEPWHMNQSFEHIIDESLSRVEGLLNVCGNAWLKLPEINSPELASTNWQALQEGYEILDAAKMNPELVISPDGRDLNFWTSLFSQLRLYQENHQPRTRNQLKKESNADGLLLEERVANHWSDIVPNSPGWSVSVISGTSTDKPNPHFEGLDYYGNTEDGSMLPSLANFLAKHPGRKFGINDIHHPSSEHYLTLQALRLFYAEDMLDAFILHEEFACWLGVPFKPNHLPNFMAPYGLWSPLTGLLVLGDDELNSPLFKIRPGFKG